MKKYSKQNVYYFKNVNAQYLHIGGINLSINASQIVWIALKDYKKLFYCFFYLFGPNHKVQLVLYLSSKLRESFPYFSQRSLSYLFLLKGSWQKYQNYNSTLKFGEEKLAHYLFWPCVNLFHVVINLCWFFLCQLFSKGILLQFCMMQDRKSKRFCSHFSTIL